jgi:hypothetical protein
MATATGPASPFLSVNQRRLAECKPAGPQESIQFGRGISADYRPGVPGIDGENFFGDRRHDHEIERRDPRGSFAGDELVR